MLVVVLKAAIYYGPKQLEIKDVDVPKVGEGEILVKVRAVGLCPTDVRIYFFGSSSVKPPIILGHEFAGEVVEIGGRVSGLEIGDKVNVPADAFCGKCKMCRIGRENLCEDPLSFGYNIDGAYAEYVKIPKRFLSRGVIFHLPDNISFEEATFVEPVACSINGVRKAGIEAGKSVVIIGDGPMGLTQVQLSRLFGADSIILIGLHDWKLQLAKKLGADYTINALHSDPVEEVLNLTDGRGADSVVVTIGVPEVIEQGLKMAGKNGFVNIFGGSRKGSTITIDPNILHYYEICFTGSSGYTFNDYEFAYKLVVKRKINVKKLISHKFKLSELFDAINQFQNKEKSLKIIIEPTGE